jgi:hypothetical protein
MSARIEVAMDTPVTSLQPTLGPNQSVYTRDGQRVGQIQRVACDAFKIWDTPERPGFWLRTDVVDRVTPGSVVYLSIDANEIDDAGWMPSPDLKLWADRAP